MQNFIVLGLVPGTHLEITFTLWVCGAVLLAGLPFLRQLWHHRTNIYNYAVALRFARFIDQFQIPA